MYKAIFKRPIDVIFSLFLILFFSPLFLLIAIIVKIDSKGPVFFNQLRLGKNGRTFKIFKYRTMFDKLRESSSEIFKENKEVTRSGYFLRRFKLDEIPQLFNILKGDMSFIGPRPCLPNLIKEFNEDAFFRIKIRPGLTGLAQVNGNIHLTWVQRWIFDRYYVCNVSFLLDLKIFTKTILIVLLGEEKFIKEKCSK